MDDGRVVATYTATDLNKAGGKVLDDAGHSTVRIKRRGTSYLLMREETLDGLLAAARDGRPQSLEDLVRGYDAAKVKSLTRGFLTDTPALGDVVHLNWAPSEGREMKGPHHALVLSADLYNVGTGLLVVCPVTCKVGKLSDFEFPVRVGRVNGAAILSELRSLDYQARSIQFEGKLPGAGVAEANRRVRMIFP